MECVQTPGAMLRQAREERQMSLPELSAVTRISTRLLESLEDDRYEEFPAEVFVRGFLRNCARELRIDPDDLVAIYDRRTGRQTTRQTSVSTDETAEVPMGPLFGAGRSQRFSYVIALLAIVLGLGLSIIIFGDNATEELSDSDPASTIETWQNVSP